ncbi:hypothetical protein GCM10029976_046770 [Kribbella albertanoniae]|uniref:Uncharacterized protein n=1 Tax=Kribbella albertanoniae TaxID=1266829 RepID=A0A4R4Q4Q4_9ACTN|nr:hypothetical protein [Kribbella albertanoniae]TDC29813.1 hypothetical protein E1261_14870 [Kribbella albertanoniae]
MAEIEWNQVREFTLGVVARPATRKRNRIEWGPKAIRVPQGSKDDRVFTPCAYVASGGRLTLDPEEMQVLCSVAEVAENSFEVRDGQAVLIGTITRVPSGRPMLRPTWRMDQPGHPEIVGRTEWLSGSPKELAAKAAGRLFTGVLDAITSAGDEGGDQPTKDRVLEWRAGDEVVMLSESTKSVTLKADWLDRRLPFAYTLIAEG